MKIRATLLFSMAAVLFMDQAGSGAEMQWVIDKEATMERLQEHLRALTVDIGERSARRPENLKKTEEYILSFYRDLGVSAYTESYPCSDRSTMPGF